MSMPWDPQTEISTNGYQLKLDDRTYHASPIEVCSAHRLQKFLDSPPAYKAWFDGQIDEIDKPAYVFGRAAHVFILEGIVAFEDRYLASDGPINPKTDRPYGRDTQKYAEWLAAQKETGKEIITDNELELIHGMDDAIWNCDISAYLLDGSCGVPEVTLRAEIEGVNCQSRIDWIDDKCKCFVDLKTTSELGQPPRDDKPWSCDFVRDAERFGYLHQMAFYRLMIRSVYGVNYDCCMIAVESKPPHEVAVFEISKPTLDLKEAEVLAGIREYRKCVESDNWPSRFDRMFVL